MQLLLLVLDAEQLKWRENEREYQQRRQVKKNENQTND